MKPLFFAITLLFSLCAFSAETRKAIPSFDDLPPEGQEAADTAFRNMSNWVDQQVAQLSEESENELKSAVRDLNTEVAVVTLETAGISDGEEKIEELALDFSEKTGISVGLSKQIVVEHILQWSSKIGHKSCTL